MRWYNLQHERVSATITAFSGEHLKKVPRAFAFQLFMNEPTCQQNGHCYLLATTRLKM
jgi:hypothetical protein